MRRGLAVGAFLALAAGAAGGADLTRDDALRALGAMRLEPGSPLLPRAEGRFGVLPFRLAEFDRFDQNGGGIGRDDIDFALGLQRARQAGSFVERLVRADLDLDGVLTAEERRRAAQAMAQDLSSQPLPRLSQAEADLFLAGRDRTVDLDGDGIWTLAETIAAARAHADSPEVRLFLAPKIGKDPELGEDPMRFDADGDGVVARAEFEAAVRQGFAELDTDRDGALSAGELEPLEAFRRAERRAAATRDRDLRASLRGKPRPPCRIDVPEGALLALVGTTRGAGRATSAIAGPRANTSVADLEVEPGEAPLVLALLSVEPTILRVRGATERLVGVIPLGAPLALAGAGPGILRAASEGCRFSGWNFLGRLGADDVVVVRQAAGRAPDVVVAHETLGRLSLPGGGHALSGPLPGAAVLPGEGPAAPLWQRFAALWPGGLVEVAPETVTDGTAEPYAILPGTAGLARLVEAGALRLEDAGELGGVPPDDLAGGVDFSAWEGEGGLFLAIPHVDGRRWSRIEGAWRGGRLPVLTLLAPTPLPWGLHGIEGAVIRVPAELPAPDRANGAEIVAE